MLSFERASELLRYDDNTGQLIRKVATSNSVKVGDTAGYVGKNGYVYLHVDGKCYLAHRVVWLLKYRRWPQANIDHINGVKTDNRAQNLRCVTAAINNQNKRKATKGNTSGLLGVSWMTRAKKWRAQIQVDGKITYLGLFTSRDDASNAYISAKKLLHPGYVI